MDSPTVSGTPSPLRFRVTEGGVPVDSYDVVHERQLHLMSVRETAGEYDDFQHVHPTYRGDGVWELPDFSTDQGGRTRLVADFTTRGRSQQAQAVIDTTQGAAVTALAPAPTYRAAIGQVTAGAGALSVDVNVSDALGQPAAGFEPYLGAPAHWALFARAADGSTKLVHGHATPSTTPGTLQFHVELPAGVQALQGWLQVKPAGSPRLQTIPLDLNAGAVSGSSPATNAPMSIPLTTTEPAASGQMDHSMHQLG